MIRPATGAWSGPQMAASSGSWRPSDRKTRHRRNSRSREINSGVYAFAGGALLPALDRIGNDNAQGEYYLPDVLPILRAQGRVVTALELDDIEETLQVNDRVQLAAVRAVAQRRINEALMLGGATIIDPANTVIDVDVTLASDTLIEPGTALHGSTSVGEGSTIGPHTTLADTIVGRESERGPLVRHRRDDR